MAASKCTFPKAGVTFPVKKFLSKINDTSTGTTFTNVALTDVFNSALRRSFSHFTKCYNLH